LDFKSKNQLESVYYGFFEGFRGFTSKQFLDELELVSIRQIRLKQKPRKELWS